MQEHYAAGDNIASRCTKCKLVLDHTIVAMAGEKIAKVSCRTCGRTHKHHDPQGTPKAGRSAKAATERTSPDALAAKWTLALAEAEGKARPYSMTAKFKVGDIVDHERFGRGIVQAVYDRKCGVLFQDKERLMATGV